MATAEPVPTFAAVTGRPSRHGKPTPAELVEACLTTIGATSSSARPSAVQSRTWQLVLTERPPDLVAIAPTGSGKTLAFLLPAFLELMHTAPPGSAAGASPEPGAHVAEPPPPPLDPDAAMRTAAAAAFKRALAAGVPSDEAKAVARSQGKTAWKAAKAEQAQRDAAAAAAPSHAATRAAATPSDGTPAASPSVLILAPTRELCQQTADTARKIAEALCAKGRDASSLATGCVVGGVDYRGQRAHLLSGQPRLLVATPGRLLSLCGETPASTKLRQASAQGLNAASKKKAAGESANTPL